MHEEARDPALLLPGELLRAGPVAAQADLDVSVRVDDACLDEPVHGRPVRDLDAEDLRAGVGVRVEVDEPDRLTAGRARADVRLRNRVVTAEDDRDRAGLDHLADGALDCLVRAGGIGREHRRVAVVDHPQHGHGVDLRLEMGPGRAARRADRPRAEAGARPVGDEVVRRRADDRDVDPAEVCRVLRVRQRPEREQACVVGLLAVLPPALEGVDHRAIVACPAARRSPTTRSAASVTSGCAVTAARNGARAPRS